MTILIKMLIGCGSSAGVIGGGVGAGVAIHHTRTHHHTHDSREHEAVTRNCYPVPKLQEAPEKMPINVPVTQEIIKPRLVIKPTVPAGGFVFGGRAQEVVPPLKGTYQTHEGIHHLALDSDMQLIPELPQVINKHPDDVIANKEFVAISGAIYQPIGTIASPQYDLTKDINDMNAKFEELASKIGISAERLKDLPFSTTREGIVTVYASNIGNQEDARKIYNAFNANASNRYETKEYEYFVKALIAYDEAKEFCSYRHAIEELQKTIDIIK